MASGKIQVGNVGTKPPAKNHNIKWLDLAFAMDTTGSMGSYIDSARDNIRRIVDEIVASEKSDVRLALVNYRDHPPQDSSYVTQVNDFTSSPNTMKQWLTSTSASGGGDYPEAVADALHAVLKLSWRANATKICVCISDAPPHGLGCSGDEFPDGCPAGIDPMEVTEQMARRGITLYTVGCDLFDTLCSDFFMAIAFKTGGQYVPLEEAKDLAQVIIGGAKEEMALEELMTEVNELVKADVAAGKSIDESEMTKRVHRKMMEKGVQSKQLLRNDAELESAHENAGVSFISKLTTMSDVRDFKTNIEPLSKVRSEPSTSSGASTAARTDHSASTKSERFETVDMPISESQSRRLVKKSLARNMVNKK